MPDKTRTAQYRYTISMAYLDQKRGKSIEIKNEYIKYLIIDHNYENNCMPVLYTNIVLDKKIIDDMILNCNDNLLMLALYKYDNLTNEKLEIECFRKKFIYFLPNDVNKTDSIEYTESSIDENISKTHKSIVLGLLCVDHINNNKRSFNLLLKDTNIGLAVNQVVDHFDNLIMEPIGDATVINQLMLPEKNSVSTVLRALNNVRAFYNTPYIYYQDFNFTYLLSSSFGKRFFNVINRKDIIKKISRKNTLYNLKLFNSVILNIGDVLDVSANNIGLIINKTAETYQIPVSYANTQIYDDTITNKSKTTVTGITSSGKTQTQLKNKTSYMTDKNVSVRLNNDNERLLDNITSDANNNFFVYVQKSDLDIDVLIPGRRITINHIDQYKDHNGDYLMYRKRECFIREDSTFVLNTMINLKELRD
jgi:hypothetical protein